MRQVLVCLAEPERLTEVRAASADRYQLETELLEDAIADLLVVDAAHLQREAERIREIHGQSVRAVLLLAAPEAVEHASRQAREQLPFDDFVSPGAPPKELRARIDLCMARGEKQGRRARVHELEAYVRDLGFRALAEDTPDVVARYDRALRYQYVNNAITRVTGLSPEFFLGKTHREVGFSEEHAAFWDETLRAGFATGESARVEYTLPRPEGLRYFESRLAPERAPDGSIPSVLVVSRDMTERVLAEAAVRRSEARLAEAMALAETGSWEYDPETHTSTWSKEMYRLLGVDPSVPIPATENLLAHVHPDDRRVLRSLRELANQPDATRTVECRVLPPGGQVRYLLTRARSSVDPRTQRRCVAGVTTDITDRKFRELERESERNLLEMVARGAALDECLEHMVHTQEALFPGTLCTVSTYLNEHELSLVAGLDDYPDVHRELSIIRVAADSTPCGRAAHARARLLADDLAHAATWHEFREIARKLRAESCVSVPILSSQRELLGTFAMYFRESRAPTPEEARCLERAASLAGVAIERDRTHAALAENEALLRTVFDNSPVGIYLCDAFGRVVYVNRAVGEVLGIPREKVLGRRWFARLHREDRRVVAESLRGLLRGEVQSLDLTWRHKTPDGEAKTLQVHASTIAGAAHEPAARKGFVGTVEDITARIKLEEQLRHAQKMEAVGQLAGGVAHDFNNLLTVILNGLALLAPQGAPRDRQLVRQIELAAERAATLTRQLLAFGRRQRMSTQVVDLNELVLNLCDMLRRLIGEQNTLKPELAQRRVQAQVDPNMIEQVLLNLVVNARDAMPRGGTIILRLRNTPDGAPAAARPGEHAYVCLSVIDTGEGIAPEHLPRVFEPFFTTKEPGKGTGLGLATVYAIVERHGGFVEVDSRLGGGTAVSVYLPRVEAPASAGSTRPKAPPLGSETILLAEDEHAVREMVRTSLESCGYRVLEANNGDEALAIWRQHRREIALLVTDVVMPGSLLGGELALRLRAERPDLRVVYMSGYGGQDLALDSLSRFVAKPFQISTLGQLVRDCLDSPAADGGLPSTAVTQPRQPQPR